MGVRCALLTAALWDLFWEFGVKSWLSLATFTIRFILKQSYFLSD